MNDKMELFKDGQIIGLERLAEEYGLTIVKEIPMIDCNHNIESFTGLWHVLPRAGREMYSQKDFDEYFVNLFEGTPIAETHVYKERNDILSSSRSLRGENRMRYDFLDFNLDSKLYSYNFKLTDVLGKIKIHRQETLVPEIDKNLCAMYGVEPDSLLTPKSSGIGKQVRGNFDVQASDAVNIPKLETKNYLKEETIASISKDVRLYPSKGFFEYTIKEMLRAHSEENYGLVYAYQELIDPNNFRSVSNKEYLMFQKCGAYIPKDFWPEQNRSVR